MKNKIMIIFLAIFMLGAGLQFISSTSEEVNYSVSYDYNGVQISSLKYEPYPASPGEYFDIWIKVSLGYNADYVKFELIEDYPFNLDDGEDAVREYERADSSEIVIHYKVRIDEDAVEGVNELKISVNTDEYKDISEIVSFEIQVANAQTDFDMVIQDSTTSEISIAIANIGKNTANSMIVRIPEQESYKVTGTNGQMVGNLESGDYTIASFSLTKVGRSVNPLKVQIDYTDSIGERRNVTKEVEFVSESYGIGENATMSDFPGGISGDFAGNFPGKKKTTTWPYIVAGVLIVILGGLFVYSKNSKKIKCFFSKNAENKRNIKEKNSEIPGWMKKEIFRENKR